MEKQISIALMIAASSLALTSCKEAPKEDNSVYEVAVDESEWGKFVDRYLNGYFKLDPSTAVYQGKHEYDGKLADWSDAGLKVKAEYLTNAIEEAQSFDASTLDAKQLFERDYLISVAQGELFWLIDADAPHKNPSWYFDNGLDPSVYIARPYADAATRMKAFISYAKAIPKAAKQIKANLKLPLPLSFVDYGKAGFDGFAEFYTGDAKAAFAEVKDEALQKEFDEVAAAATQAMKELSVYMESARSTATQDFALGAAKFSKMVKDTEGVDISLDELENIGLIDLKRNQNALKTACTEFAPGATMGDCMAKMASDKPADGPVAEARRQLPPLREFLVEKDLVSIPGTEEALVEESPPYNRQNSAYIDIPGPYEKGLPSVYYISPPDPSWDEETRKAYVPGKKDLLGTSVHEVWPGHFLNFLHANRASSFFGRVFVGYAFAEGWAHYGEELMVEAGLHDGDPETRIGQLSNALLRNCRYLSAIGLHARGMTQEQSKKMFREQCYQDEGNSLQQAARGTYDPAYLNYTMGKLMIRKLREDWTSDKGGRKAWKAFHDDFLSYGGPPIPMVRKAMMKEDEAKAVF